MCFWTSLFPGGGEGANAESFFETYLSFPILLACYFGHKLYTRSWRLLTPTKEIDLDSGRRAVDLELMKDEKRIEEQAMRQKSLFARFIHLWC